MAFSISDFHASINRHGLAKNHSFRMRITPPPVIFGQVQNRFPVVNDSIHFYCRSVTLPELDITTADVQHQGFGAITRRPQTLNFPVLATVFNVDAGMDIVKYFQLWSQYIINFDRSEGNFGNVDGMLPFEMGYKKDYATVMNCDVYDSSGFEVMSYEFSGAYPVNVGNVETAWANNDEVMNLPVGFTYDTLRVTGSENPDPSRFGDRTTTTNPFSSSRGTIAEAPIQEITDDAQLREQLQEPEVANESRLNRSNASQFARRTRRGG